MPKLRTFDQFMVNVEIIMEEIARCCTLDLPDFDFYADYLDGRTPRATAKRCLKAAATF
jgi:hypothetical protein